MYYLIAHHNDIGHILDRGTHLEMSTAQSRNDHNTTVIKGSALLKLYNFKEGQLERRYEQSVKPQPLRHIQAQ